MSTVLTRMVQRSRGPLSAIEPLIPPRYAASDSVLDPGASPRAAGPLGEARLAPEADAAAGTRPSGPDGRPPSTDRRGTGAPAPLAGHAGPQAGSGPAWAGPPREVPEADTAPDDALPMPSLQPPQGASPGDRAARFAEGRASASARQADADRPVTLGWSLPEHWALPESWARDGGPLTPSPKAPSPGQRPQSLGGAPDDTGDGLEPPHPAGPRSARHASSRLAREEGARLDASFGALPGKGPGTGPALTITIGHIEVRAAAPQRTEAERGRAGKPAGQQFRPQVSLAEFLGRPEPGQARRRGR